ncbi:Sensor histidine kinase YehU [compost metagenome]
MNRRLLLLLFLLCTVKAYSQEYNYMHYATKDGLSGETTYTGTQSQDGFIWFGTESGLSRFDGVHFRNFTTNDGLPSNEVFGTREDFAHRIWIQSFSKEVAYYKNGKIYQKFNDPLVRKIILRGQFSDASKDHNGQVIVNDNLKRAITIEGQTVRHYAENQFKLNYLNLPLNGGINFSLLQLPEQTNSFILQHFQTTAVRAIEALRIAPDILVFTLDKWDNIAWNSTENRFFRISKKGLRLRWAMRDGNILGVYASGGACIYNLSTQKVTSVFLPQYQINGVFEDYEGNIWFCTNGNGIYKLGALRVLTYSFSTGEPSPVNFIFENGKYIYTGNDRDVMWQLGPTTSVGQFPPVFPQKKSKLNHADLIRNAQNQLLSMRNNILKLPGNVGNIKSVFVYKDSLLLATHRDAALYKKEGHSIWIENIYTGRTTTAIICNGYYCIGTLEELLVLNKQYTTVASPVKAHISCLTRGNETDVLWVGTHNKGFFRVQNNQKTDSFTIHNSKLSSNLCRCIYNDGRFLWVGTDQGLHKFRILKNTLSLEYIYTTQDGLNSNLINSVLIKDGILYVGTPKGLNIFREPVSVQKPLLNLAFTGIYVQDSVIDISKSIILPHQNNHIKFEFSAISFSLNNISYRYRILGLDTGWQYISEPLLNLISLPSGSYTVQVQALHPSGYQSPVIEKKFRVQKAVFEYWWFRVLVLLFSFSIVWLAMKIWIRKIRKKEEERRSVHYKMIELEQMALRAQMNPHFIFNCINSIQNYVLKQDVSGANYYLSQFAGLVRETLDNAHKIHISLQEELSYLQHYIELERLQVNEPFQYTINVDPQINRARTLFPNMILQPLVENAIKHGLCHAASIPGLLIINIRRAAPGLLICTIEDNGPGIDHHKNASTHQSKGLSLIYQRIETLNLINKQSGEIKLHIEDRKKEHTQGTRVTIWLPELS